MSTWMSEKEFRQAGAEEIGVTINVPFLKEIKQDSEFRQLLTAVYERLNALPSPTPRTATEMLAGLRDQLETYFALEEFYGYARNALETNPTLSRQAATLKAEHRELFLQFHKIVETSEQIVYHECSAKVTVKQLAEQLDSFCLALANHEQREMDLMMRKCNQDTGVGD